MKKPRQSRLSQTTRIKHLEEENQNYQDFIDDLMTLLEDYNFLEPEDLEDEEEPAERTISEVLILPPEQDESQHPEDDNPGDEP
jgi:hypothetical protein